MQDGLRDLLEKRRNRALAALLGAKERDCDPHLPREVSLALRKTILDQINEYHAVVMDILDSLVDDSEVSLNAYYLTLIDEMHNDMREVAARIGV